MLELSRTVRLCVNADAPDPDLGPPTEPRDNTFVAWPPPRGLARYFELRVLCRGHAHPQTGYFINIRDIDAAAREHALPQLIRATHQERTGQPTPLGGLLSSILDALQPPLNGTVQRLELRLTPMTTMTVTATDPSTATATARTVLVRQRYEFSAAHRLHVPDYSDEQNRDIFGKCNNPAGHGHNYAFEVAVEAPIDEHGHTLDVGALDALVDRQAVDKLDHTHLNHDVPEFAGLNPSVENISTVVWDYLVDAMPTGCALREVTVWETGKTSCTYRGPAA